MIRIAFYFFGILLLSGASCNQELPDGFVYIDEKETGIKLELRYCTENNFVGRPIKGYYAKKCILSAEAAQALLKIQKQLKLQGLGLKVYDAYRPQMAVDHFVKWAKDLDDTLKKAAYYPHVAKSDLFDKGYIAARSGHSRGSTLDVTLIRLGSGRELDMGTSYDYFSPLSHPTNTNITDKQFNNRMLLQDVMQQYGFLHLPTEWWHFTLDEEPYPDTYFNFPVK